MTFLHRQEGKGALGIVVAVVALAAVAGGLFWFFAVHQSDEAKLERERQEVANNLESGNAPLDENWQIYKDAQLGISLKIPRASQVPGEARQPVQAMQYQNILFVVSQDQQAKVEQAVQQPVSNVKKTVGIPWAIIVADVASDTELDAFIKERYGQTCAAGEQKKTDQSDVYRVEIAAPQGSSPEDGGCFVNYQTEIRYDKKAGRVAAWDIGQAPNFFIDGQSVDEEMVKSFEFLR